MWMAPDLFRGDRIRRSALSSAWFWICVTTALSVQLCAQSEPSIKIAAQAFTPENSFTHSVEGPAVDSAGNLFACNFEHQGTIGKIDAEGKGTVFTTLPASGRSAGLRFDSRGFLIVLDHVNHLVYRVDPTTGQFLEVLTRDWTGPVFRQPNDLTIAPDDTIYFSDPDWRSPTGGRVFMVTSGSQRHTVQVADHLDTPNGITVSPNGRIVYVGQSKAHNILAFDRDADGTLRNQRMFFDTATISPTALPDGMRCDKDGNLYVAMVGLGRILVIGSRGELLPTMIRTMGLSPSNLTFGPDGRTIFITEVEHRRIEKIILP
jgi:sugar lactone lactonase YvrE